MARVAVTGGAGFLGSNLAKRLVEDGHEVSIVDDLSSGSIENLRGLGVDEECLVGDLKNYEFARKLSAERRRSSTLPRRSGASRTFTARIEGARGSPVQPRHRCNVFRACLENKVGSVVYASSVSVYPFDEQLGSQVKFKEEDSERKVNPEGGYGWSKYIGEKQLALMPETSCGVAGYSMPTGRTSTFSPTGAR